MTIQLTVDNMLEDTMVVGDFGAFVKDLNLAAASGHKFVVLTEIRNGEHHPVAIDTQAIRRAREVESDSFIGM
jgi:hypothetical protein